MLVFHVYYKIILDSLYVSFLLDFSICLDILALTTFQDLRKLKWASSSTR